jgi:hypothetical protein
MFIFYCCITGFVTAGLLALVSSKIKSKLISCTVSCIIGMIATVVILWLFICTTGSVSKIGVSI